MQTASAIALTQNDASKSEQGLTGPQPSSEAAADQIMRHPPIFPSGRVGKDQGLDPAHGEAGCRRGTLKLDADCSTSESAALAVHPDSGAGYSRL